MEADIPSNYFPPKPWFDCSCSCCIMDGAYWMVKFFSSPDIHFAYISAQNHYEAVLWRAKCTFIKRKCADLTSTDTYFRSLTKSISNNFCNSTFPPLSQPDQSFANSQTLFSSKSALDGLDSNLPTPTPPSEPIPSPILSSHNFFQILLQIQLGKVYDSDGITTLCSKGVTFKLAPILAHLFCLCLNTWTFTSVG